MTSNDIQFTDGNTVGIDLGTTSSSLGIISPEGMPTIIDSGSGSPVTSSVIILGEGGCVIVGPPPEQVISEDPDRIVVAIKREMGNQNYAKIYENRRMTPELLSSMILMKLKQDAEKKIGAIGNAVITVPYYFNEPCRQATRHAGRIAGLNVIDIINEPTAATLAYAWHKGEFGRTDLPNDPRTILVYDLGGGTFDVTVVKYTPTQFTVIATDGDTFLGGLDWTHRIVDHVCDRFRGKFGVDPRDDGSAKLAITKECEDAKKELSLWRKTPLHIDFRGQSLPIELTRTEFEQITADLLQRTRDTTDYVLDNAGVKAADLDDIVLVGGSTAMPAVLEMLERLSGKPPSRDLLPQLAVAQGAAIHAAILEVKATGGSGQMAKAVINRLKAVTSTDVNSHSLGVEITEPSNPNAKRNHIMIPRNSKLPCGVKQRFVTNLDNPIAVHLRLLEGEASDVDACTFIGDFKLTKLPEHLKAGSPVEVHYRYDERGHIHVSLTDLTGKNSAAIEINWNGGMDSVAIESFQKLVQEYSIE